MMDRAVPTLPSRDLDATVRFYSGFGFTAAYRSDELVILRRGDLHLEFFPFPDLDPGESSFMCSVRIDDLDGLYRQIADAGVPEAKSGFPRLHPPRMESWGGRVAFLVDPDGTQLALVQNG
ncbi:bleomycin resistance protein [Microbacterium sp. MM2322]|uniref:bleomycin resistance protein n=1 Tax=Microbacterium sp. MM2322 TaxID=3157631 RepID=UPI0032D570EB